jgi:hypothetical protein
LRDKATEAEGVREGDVVHIPDLIVKEEPAATGQTHQYTRKGLPLRTEPFEIILENIEKLRLPFVHYEVTFANGEKRKGALDLNGYALLENSPPGEVEILFKDHADIAVKSLAACASAAFHGGDEDDVWKMLKEPAESLQLAIAAYDSFFNVHSGEGFVRDVHQQFKNHAALTLVEALLALGGAAVESQHEFIESDSEGQGGDDFDDIDELDEVDEIEKLYEGDDSSSLADTGEDEEECSGRQYESSLDDELTSLMGWDE